MIKARHSVFFVWFFRIFSRGMIHRHFSRVIIRCDFEDNGLPVLLLGNHFSWWDGFIANYLNIKIFKRKFHVMMLEEELRHRMFLNRAGAFSIDKGKRTMVESLNYAAELLMSHENLLVLYPQGKFQSIHHLQVRFEKGFVTVCHKAAEKGFHLVFYVALTEYFERRKPQLFLYIREHPCSQGMTATELESAYNDFYKDSIRVHSESL